MCVRVCVCVWECVCVSVCVRAVRQSSVGWVVLGEEEQVFAKGAVEL